MCNLIYLQCKWRLKLFVISRISKKNIFSKLPPGHGALYWKVMNNHTGPSVSYLVHESNFFASAVSELFVKLIYKGVVSFSSPASKVLHGQGDFDWTEMREDGDCRSHLGPSLHCSSRRRSSRVRSRCRRRRKLITHGCRKRKYPQHCFF